MARCRPIVIWGKEGHLGKWLQSSQERPEAGRFDAVIISQEYTCHIAS